MKGLMSFEGRIGRAPYALASVAVFLSQYVAVAGLYGAFRQRLDLGWRFLFLPLRSVVDLHNAPAVILALAFALTLLAAWALSVLAFRRAADAGVSGWLAAAVIVPVVQALVILGLSAISAKSAPTPSQAQGVGGKRPFDWPTATQGMLAGMGLTVFTVAIGALIFGAYGYGMFVVGPFLIGATTAYLANRKGDISGARTIGVVLCATALGGVALVAASLEGVICIVLASPLAALVASVGGLLGRSVAGASRPRASHSLMSFAFLPIVFLSEQMFPPSTIVETSQSIDVAAPAPALWRALIRMDGIDSAPSLPRWLGVARPVSAWVIGEGVGARRIGVFSTGVATERVTQWRPDRELAFVVLSDPPAMRELSPYRHVNAPHAVGYFHTTSTSFELVPLTTGRTRVVLRTAHELRLDPVLYWLPLARWVVSRDNATVLAYVKRRAEGSISFPHRSE